ncbi:MAG: tRNA glutamyl-Q(34) synthetase GluQRS [Candidatus Sumerlaeia bacterium]|nr:tRNA glutamyl-Q(34) synthetase GluQRS [Candidatus Sumerlaeia bacterium]
MVVGRYAPSPTGALHLGNLRTAVAAWASARARGGRCLLRIEDIDRARSRPEHEVAQLRDLAALGLAFDGVPERQSARLAHYHEALAELRARGFVYPCFCSRRELRDVQSAPHSDGAEPPYPGRCRALDPAEAAAMAATRQHCLRLRVADAPKRFRDAFLGEREIDLELDGGDFVVRRADGEYGYQLACAVDDALQGVTEVVRGEDLLVSGARQSWLLACLGRAAPQYRHIPLVRDAAGRRLSKREGDDDLSAFIACGFDSGAVLSYLAWTLGQCDRGEHIAPAALAARWTWDGVPQEPAVFDAADLEPYRR